LRIWWSRGFEAGGRDQRAVLGFEIDSLVPDP